MQYFLGDERSIDTQSDIRMESRELLRHRGQWLHTGEGIVMISTCPVVIPLTASIAGLCCPEIPQDLPRSGGAQVSTVLDNWLSDGFEERDLGCPAARRDDVSRAAKGARRHPTPTVDVALARDGQLHVAQLQSTPARRPGSGMFPGRVKRVRSPGSCETKIAVATTSQ